MYEYRVDPDLKMLLGQLLWQLPLLLVYAAGMVLALVFWRRCPAAGAMTLIGAGVLFLAAVGQPCLSAYLIHLSRNSDLGMRGVGGLMAASAVAGSILRAVAMGLLLAAVFVGRRAAGERGE